ncbi:MAG: hypothetical protein ACREX0_01860 [Noviherbaspirillum sp.]
MIIERIAKMYQAREHNFQANVGNKLKGRNLTDTVYNRPKKAMGGGP